MNTATAMRSTGEWLHRYRGLALPLAVAAALLVVLVPLPPDVINVLLIASLALSVVILLTAVNVSSPMEFSVLPTVLLGATLFRLALNVATTRLILTAGADGRSLAEAQQAAGGVLWAFGQFVTAGSLTVGIILFAIIAVIQFAVVTKGATRISEVAARFALDAMPGRQMSIDADLASGAIDADEASSQRRHLAREADFYGAMDGASKFVRGDAVATVIITAVNLLGGLYVGIVQYNWTLPQTAGLYTRLTIGDGLAVQVPALLVSVAAALVVTRSGGKTNLGDEVVRQLAGRPVVLVLGAGLLAALVVTPLPKIPLLLVGGAMIALAAMVQGRIDDGRESPAASSAAPAATGRSAEANELSLPAVDPIRVELGYALVELVDGPAGGLLERVGELRRQIAGELGVLIPPVKICDNLRLPSHSYCIRIRNARVAGDRLWPRQLLAVGAEATTGSLVGRGTNEPAFGTPAVWIAPTQRRHAEIMNYTVVSPVSVLVTHLGEVIRGHAALLLGRQQVDDLLADLEGRCGSLLKEVRQKYRTGQVQKLMQSLLAERVPLHDMEAVLEALADFPGPAEDIQAAGEWVRTALARTLSQQYCGQDGKLWCVSLDAELESALSAEPGGGLQAGVFEGVADALAEPLADLQRQGRHPVLICSPRVRPAVRRFVASVCPAAAVLAYSEVESVDVHSVATIRTQK